MRVLEERGHDPGYLTQLASMFTRIAAGQHDMLFAEFHNFAGRFPYAGDSDIGALILEREADDTATGALRARLYREAMWRAIWCAQASTAGGEGLARSIDVDRLTAKTTEAEQAGGCDGEKPPS